MNYSTTAAEIRALQKKRIEEAEASTRDMVRRYVDTLLSQITSWSVAYPFSTEGRFVTKIWELKRLQDPEKRVALDGIVSEMKRRGFDVTYDGDDQFKVRWGEEDEEDDGQDEEDDGQDDGRRW